MTLNWFRDGNGIFFKKKKRKWISLTVGVVSSIDSSIVDSKGSVVDNDSSKYSLEMLSLGVVVS